MLRRWLVASKRRTIQDSPPCMHGFQCMVTNVDVGLTLSHGDIPQNIVLNHVVHVSAISSGLAKYRKEVPRQSALVYEPDRR